MVAMLSPQYVSQRIEKLYWTFLNDFIVGIVRAELGNIESTSVVIMWVLLSPTEIISTYTISYHNINNTLCFNDSDIVTGITAMQYTLRNLEEATEYSITVSLSDGEEEEFIRAITIAAGQNKQKWAYVWNMIMILSNGEAREYLTVDTMAGSQQL